MRQKKMKVKGAMADIMVVGRLFRAKKE